MLQVEAGAARLCALGMVRRRAIWPETFPDDIANVNRVPKETLQHQR